MRGDIWDEIDGEREVKREKGVAMPRDVAREMAREGVGISKAESIKPHRGL